MQPAVSEIEGLAANLDPGFGPSWAAIASLVAAAVGLSWLSRRAAHSPALHRWHRGLHLAIVAAGGLAAWFAGLRLIVGGSLSDSLGRAVLLAILGAVALPFLRDVWTGIALVLEGRHRLGDDLRVGAHQGRIVAWNLRSVVLRDHDGTETVLPHHRLAANEVVRLNHDGRDAACEIEVALPDHGSVEAVSAALLEAAMLSPYSAPGRRAEVFVVAEPGGGVRIRVRAYVFDRAYEPRYRGDVLARVSGTGAAQLGSCPPSSGPPSAGPPSAGPPSSDPLEPDPLEPDPLKPRSRR